MTHIIWDQKHYLILYELMILLMLNVMNVIMFGPCGPHYMDSQTFLDFLWINDNINVKCNE